MKRLIFRTLRRSVAIINRESLKKIQYLPRWITFFTDVVILTIAVIASYAIVSRLTNFSYDTLGFYTRYCIVIGVNMVFFLVFKTYSGIVRHSTFSDGLKLLYSTTSSLLVLIVINYITYSAVGKKIYVIPKLIVYYIVSFVLLFLFRIMVKFLFENFISRQRKAKLKRVLIFGSDSNVISVARALSSESPRRFRIVGFIDKKVQRSNKQILGLPIFGVGEGILPIMNAVSAQGLIIGDKTLTKEEKLELVDTCLENNFKVYNMPLISNYDDDAHISEKVKDFQIQDLLEREPIVLHNESISEQLKGKVILISGAAGSIGSEITRQVVGFNPKEVIILDQAETPLHLLKLEISESFPDANVRTEICDVRSKSNLSEVFKKYRPAVVFHAAAYKHVPMMEKNPAQAIFVNVIGTKNMVDLSYEFKVSNFVFISTDKAVNPSNVMGASKRIAEKYVQSINSKIKRGDYTFKPKFITTRFGNVLGSNGSVVPLFASQIAKGGPITLTHPDIIRYFMTIPEACQLVLEAGSMGNGGEIYIFDMGEPVKIVNLAYKMIQLAGLVPEKDIEIKFIGLRPGEKLYEELLNDTSKTLPTHHEKIMIADDQWVDYNLLTEEIEELERLAHAYESKKIVSKMKAIVPEFISMNSEFCSIEELENVMTGE